MLPNRSIAWHAFVDLLECSVKCFSPDRIFTPASFANCHIVQHLSIIANSIRSSSSLNTASFSTMVSFSRPGAPKAHSPMLSSSKSPSPQCITTIHPATHHLTPLPGNSPKIHPRPHPPPGPRPHSARQSRDQNRRRHLPARVIPERTQPSPRSRCRTRWIEQRWRTDTDECEGG